MPLSETTPDSDLLSCPRRYTMNAHQNRLLALSLTSACHLMNGLPLQELLAILNPTKVCTKKLEGHLSEESATGITDMYDVLSLILSQLEKLKVEYAESQKNSAFWVAIEQAWSKATEYYNILDETLVYTARSTSKVSVLSKRIGCARR
jgi:hypothetical protein